MNHKFTLSALALVLVFAGASTALAAGKTHNGAHEAYAAVTQVSDPRVNKGGNHEGWCDVDPQCNGWAEWLRDINAGKLKAK